MRIAIASSGLGYTYRGVEAWATSLAEGLHREGENVVLLHGGGDYACPAVKLDCLRRDAPAVRLFSRLAPRSTWRWGLTTCYGLEQHLFARALLRWLRRTGPDELPDVIHTSDPVVALLLARSNGSPPVILCHQTEETPEFLGQFEHVQQLAPWHRAQAEQGASAPPTAELRSPASDTGTPRSWVIPNFVDTEMFRSTGNQAERSECRSAFGISDDAFVVGVSSAVQKTHKRVDVLIREFAQLVNSDVAEASRLHLVVAGADTAESLELTRMAAAVAPDRIRVLTNIDHADMPRLCRCFDMLLHGSLFEMMPIAVLEAMATGVPVLANTHPVLEWVVGEGGWCRDLEHEGFLVEHWSEIQSTFRKKGPQARQHVLEDFAWTAVYPKFIGMYRTVTGEA